MFDLGVIHKGRTQFRGGQQKVHKCGQGEYVISAKCGRPLKRNYTIFLEIYSVS